MLCNRLPKSASAEPAVSGMSVVQILLPLMAKAAQSGLDALMRHFLSVLAHDDMRAVTTFRVQSGMGLLHLGVQSGKLAVLAALLEESDAELWQVSCCMSIRQCYITATGEDICLVHVYQAVFPYSTRGRHVFGAYLLGSVPTQHQGKTHVCCTSKCMSGSFPLQNVQVDSAQVASAGGADVA